jgi:hypothetical protein
MQGKIKAKSECTTEQPEKLLFQDSQKTLDKILEWWFFSTTFLYGIKRNALSSSPLPIWGEG